MKKLITSIVLTLLISPFAEAANKVTISSFVGVDIGGDIGQFEETYGMSRNATRKMYMDEVVQAAMTLSQGYFNPTGMIEPLMKLQNSADQRRDINKAIDSISISFSAGELFKSEIEKLYKNNGIAPAERRIEFVSQFPRINGRLVYNSRVVYDHYVQLHITHLGRGVFRILGTLGSLNSNDNGLEKTFEGTGSLIEALQDCAKDIFGAIMENERPVWNNPNPQLKWIPGPKGVDQMDEQEAKAYCISQKSRLPMVEELILANHATNYRPGGINRFEAGEVYFSGDQRRQSGISTVVILSNDQLQVQANSGFKGKVWCVQGEMSDRNLLIKKLFSIRRKADPKGKNIVYFGGDIAPQKLQIVKAVESLLLALGVQDSQMDGTIKQSDYLEPREALEVLNQNGENVFIPEDVIQSME